MRNFWGLYAPGSRSSQSAAVIATDIPIQRLSMPMSGSGLLWCGRTDTERSRCRAGHPD